MKKNLQRAQRVGDQIQRELADLNVTIEEGLSISGIQLSKTLGTGPSLVQRFTASSARLIDLELRSELAASPAQQRPGGDGGPTQSVADLGRSVSLGGEYHGFAFERPDLIERVPDDRVALATDDGILGRGGDIGLREAVEGPLARALPACGADDDVVGDAGHPAGRTIGHASRAGIDEHTDEHVLADVGGCVLVAGQ